MTDGVLMTAALSNYNSLRNLSVLYVEDDRRIRDQLSTFLRRRCREVFTANDGAEGVSLFEAHHPDIVITDIRMPRMDGIEMARVLKDRNPATPIIVVTAHNDVQFLTRCIEVGVDHYVFKPTDVNELLRILSGSAAVVLKKLEEREQALKEARRREQELERLRGIAERASDAKSEFIANTSHELRTPLGAILGFTRLSIEENADNKKLLQNLNTIESNGEYLLRLINNLLDLSKIEAAKFVVREIIFSPMAFLADLHALMVVAARQKGLELNIKMPEPMPERIQTDMHVLRQIMVNLVGNAVKFTSRGRVDIIARPVTREGTDLMCFEVIDTGIGIDAESAKTLFRPFAQADSSVRRQYGGTGLGLAISLRLARLLGGDLFLETTAGKGCHFTALVQSGSLEGVPRRKYTDKDLKNFSGGDVPASRMSHEVLTGHILVADDYPDNRRLLGRILEKHGARVKLVENGELAVRELLRNDRGHEPYDIVLMDMQMPVMDGYTAVSRLRARGYDGPILALTAQAMKEDRQKCLEAGCDEYVTKPVDEKVLIRSILRFLPGTAAASFSSGAGKIKDSEGMGNAEREESE